MTDDGPSRRQLLTRAGVGLAATLATAGCLGAANPLADDAGMSLRARTASGTETDIKCRLSPEFVSAHPPLAQVLGDAVGSDGWARRGLSVDDGEALGRALREHCDGEDRGLYRYDGRWYFLSLRYENQDDHEHSESEGDDHHRTSGGGGSGGDGHHHTGGATPHGH